jgi:hypothetical protein
MIYVNASLDSDFGTQSDMTTTEAIHAAFASICEHLILIAWRKADRTQ